MKHRKGKERARYQIRSSVRAFFIYKDREWAEHSAECYASFFGTPVEVVDIETETVLCIKLPTNYKEVQA